MVATDWRPRGRLDGRLGLPVRFGDLSVRSGAGTASDAPPDLTGVPPDRRSVEQGRQRPQRRDSRLRADRGDDGDQRSRRAADGADQQRRGLHRAGGSCLADRSAGRSSRPRSDDPVRHPGARRRPADGLSRAIPGRGADGLLCPVRIRHRGDSGRGDRPAAPPCAAGDPPRPRCGGGDRRRS